MHARKPSARSGRRLAIAAALALLSAASVVSVGTAAADQIPVNPTTAPAFVGKTAVPHPVTSLAVPQHPFMAANGRSNLHDDGFQTDSYPRSGPLGNGVTTTSGSYNGVCGSVTFDRRGRIETVCVGLDAVTLRLLDPVTLASLAEYALPKRPPATGNPFQNFTGGGYFFLDQADRAVIGTADRHLLVVGQTPDGAGFRVEQDVDLTSVVSSGDGIISILPDWQGRYWVATKNGVVATVDRAGKTLKALDLHEVNGNSFAVGDDGVYIVTNAALYRFEAAPDGTPKVVWREVYANDGTQKPGQSQAGSGTTPTLLGTDLVAITSNADPIDVVVLRRARTLKAGVARELCHVPVFAKGASSSDQSLITDGTNLVVENNFGYEGPQSVFGGMTTQPGLARVDVSRAAATCRVAWTAGQVSAPSLVAKLALGSGLVYTYTKPAGDTTDPWYLTALDYRTGATVFQARAGAGPLLNNNYAPVSIAADGTAYVGVLGGLVALRDATPPTVPAAPVVDPRAGPRPGTARPPRLDVRCVRGGFIRLSTRDARVRTLAATRAGRTFRDTRRPLALTVRKGAPVTVRLGLTGGTHRTVRVRSTCRPRAS